MKHEYMPSSCPIEAIHHSVLLYRPEGKILINLSPDGIHTGPILSEASQVDLKSAPSNFASIHEEVRDLVSERHYPCVAAIQSIAKSQYYFGNYSGFGTGATNHAMAKDLFYFMYQQKKTKSPYLSFFATFADQEVELNEAEFESKMWKELSMLTSHPDLQFGWDPLFKSDPKDKGFCFSFGGKAFFVVGLHPQSSRKSRRISKPTLIFNLYDQFLDLMKLGTYEPMVVTNRKRDLNYQGNINPMAEKHGETWEAIQFSGRNNDDSWKCPFQHELIVSSESDQRSNPSKSEIS